MCIKHMTPNKHHALSKSRRSDKNQSLKGGEKVDGDKFPRGMDTVTLRLITEKRDTESMGSRYDRPRQDQRP